LRKSTMNKLKNSKNNLKNFTSSFKISMGPTAMKTKVIAICATMLVILTLLGLLFLPTLIGIYPILGDYIFWTVMIIASISLIVLIYQEILYRLNKRKKEKELEELQQYLYSDKSEKPKVKGVILHK